jgi:hypothetical protein
MNGPLSLSKAITYDLFHVSPSSILGDVALYAYIIDRSGIFAVSKAFSTLYFAFSNNLCEESRVFTLFWLSVAFVFSDEWAAARADNRTEGIDQSSITTKSFQYFHPEVSSPFLFIELVFRWGKF